MDKIVVDGLEKLSRSTYALASGRSGIYGMAKLLPDDFEGDDIKQPVIDGIAAQYNTPMFFKGEWVVFNKDQGQPGCFAASIARGDNIKMCVDHQIDAVFADKHSGFEVFETDAAVTFRAIVAKSKNPMALLGVVASKNRRCASIQCDIEESEVRMCGGNPVKFITKAKLNEISLVKLGLNTPSFAFIADGAKQLAPNSKKYTAAFAKQQEVYMAERRALDDRFTAGQWQALSARVSAIEAHLIDITSVEHHQACTSLAVIRDRDQWK